jgi:hypothetical protein
LLALRGFGAAADEQAGERRRGQDRQREDQRQAHRVGETLPESPLRRARDHLPHLVGEAGRQRHAGLPRADVQAARAGVAEPVYELVAILRGE